MSPSILNLQSHRVLIVEDEIFIAAELEDIVRDAGAEVVGPAMSASEAMHLIENQEVTAAVLDVRLGSHDSLGVARRLQDAGIPFVFHTGNDDKKNLSTKWPRVPIVRKPATPEELVAALVALTNR
jgi:DNA-binding response OmpR family regulator